MRARLISRAQGRAEPVGQLDEIAVGDEGVAQSLLLLFRERQQSRLANGAGLDSAGDGEVGAQRRHSVYGLREGGDRSQALESGHVGHALRVGRRDAHHKGEKPDSASQSGHNAPPAQLTDCRPILRVIETIHEPAGTGSPGAGLLARSVGAALFAAEGLKSTSCRPSRRRRVDRAFSRQPARSRSASRFARRRSASACGDGCGRPSCRFRRATTASSWS